MPNEKPGDHPVRDILIHEMQIYSERTRHLVEEIEALQREREQIRDGIRDTD